VHPNGGAFAVSVAGGFDNPHGAAAEEGPVGRAPVVALSGRLQDPEVRRVPCVQGILVGGIQARSEIEATLAEADAWLEMSGAKSYEPFLHVERAELARLIGDEATRERELREAHRLFTEIGAPVRATEVAKELDR
jgi:hypothetical protein